MRSCGAVNGGDSGGIVVSGHQAYGILEGVGENCEVACVGARIAQDLLDVKIATR